MLLIACATATLGDPFGTLPGALTAKGAGAVVATLSKIIGPHGAAATSHLLEALHELAGTGASVGDAVAGRGAPSSPRSGPSDSSSSPTARSTRRWG